MVTAFGSTAFQTQTPFRTSVDLIRLDVSVVDAAGQPVRDLRPEDFVVKVDGVVRPVSFARFYGPDATSKSGTPQTATPPTPQASTSFASN